MAEGDGLLRLPGIPERAGIFEISARFFVGNLVGVGCRMMVVGLRSGTLLGTLRMTPMCAFWAHAVLGLRAQPSTSFPSDSYCLRRYASNAGRSSAVTNPRSTTRPSDERIGGRFGGGFRRATCLNLAS